LCFNYFIEIVEKIKGQKGEIKQINDSDIIC